METVYQPIRPEGIFTVKVTHTVVHDSKTHMHYEYSYTVERRHTDNDFINLFASLVCKYGKRHAKTYALLMGIEKYQLKITLMTLTGAGIYEWTDMLAQTIAETLLKETNFPISKIAKAVGWSPAIFSRFFRKKYKCTPQQWRWRAKRLTE